MLNFSRKLIMAAALSAVALQGCRSQPPDQTIILNEHREAADPAPTPRDFAKINNSHRVILAIFDDGIDYNHPDLIRNVRFELGPDGQPVSYGADYLGNDRWASYRIVATGRYTTDQLPRESERDRKNRLGYRSEQKHNERVEREFARYRCEVDEAIRRAPGLERYLHAYRDEFEEQKSRHGTHVAGLMTYGRPDFGLIAYRLIPYHLAPDETSDEKRARRFVRNFEDAVKDAHARGARVVNLSLGGVLTAPDDPSDRRDMERYEKLKSILAGGLSKVYREYSDILFVAAAGNDKGWTDGHMRVQYPCGVEAANMLCVGALNPADRFASFTTIPLNGVNLVFAPGVDVFSTVPADRCGDLNRVMSRFRGSRSERESGYCVKDGNGQWVPGSDPRSAAKFVRDLNRAHQTCRSDRSQRYDKMSGTSMATPLVSHLAGEILADDPLLSPSEVISRIYDRAERDAIGQFEFFKLNIRRPEWSGAGRSR